LKSSNNSKVTAVTTIKRINRNLFRKETSFVCYTSSVHIQIELLKSSNEIFDCLIINSYFLNYSYWVPWQKRKSVWGVPRWQKGWGALV